VCAAAQGLEVLSDTRWQSANVRGFWRVGTWELLTRRDPAETLPQQLATMAKRVRRYHLLVFHFTHIPVISVCRSALHACLPV